MKTLYHIHSSHFLVRKPSIAFTVALMLFGTMAFGQGYQFTRARLLSGFDGKICKNSPKIATDWNGNILLSYSNLLLTGADVFYRGAVYKSEDNGATWELQAPSKSLEDQYQDGCRVSYQAFAEYSRFHSKWYALGNNTKYINDKVPFQEVKDGKPWRSPYYADIDFSTGEIKELHEIPFPYEYAGCTLFGEPYELENGDILLSFYFVTPEQTTKKSGVVSVIYRFTDDGLEVVQAGTPIMCPELNRGVCEPSLTFFEGKYYMTVRSDERGMYCVSEDGLTFGPLKTWCWEDGTPIGNKNTQQHWINLGDKLYLAYTRENGTNNHVFRNRAPIYTARFDPQSGTLLRHTEFALVPELGARLGNFCTINDNQGNSFLITAEWMQPIGCEKYGSDNSLWFINIKK